MAGKYPTPNSLKLCRGSESRHLRNILQPGPAAPEPPAWLSDEAKAKWSELAPELVPLGLLTRLDVTAFAMFCIASVGYIKAITDLRKAGLTYTGDSGLQKTNPLVGVADTYGKQVLELAKQFGLTPLARTRLDIPSGKWTGGVLNRRDSFDAFMDPVEAALNAPDKSRFFRQQDNPA